MQLKILKLRLESESIKLITEETCYSYIMDQLKGVKNLKEFCRNNDLCYNNVIAVKNGKGSKYPLLVKSLFSILCGIDIEELKLYEITRNDNKTTRRRL